MTLASTAKYAEEIFFEKYPEKIERGKMLMSFLEEEFQLTTERKEQLMSSGSTEVSAGALNEDRQIRFLLWFYINHLSTPKYSRPMN
jgi:hypothetical protein